MVSNIWPFTKAIDFSGLYPALDVAEYIVNKCSVDGCQISNLQLQKILYYVQKHFLQVERYALFTDDIEAWPLGPVVRKAYYRFYGFGAMPIYYKQLHKSPIDESYRSAINQITEEKRIINPWEMVDDTHVQGKAWNRVFRGGQGYKELIPIYNIFMLWSR